jgi:hypothetical protein
MKFKIDTENKTITINEAVNLKELFDIIKSMFPEDWKEYNLIVETNFITTPLDIKPYPWNEPHPWQPVVPYEPNKTYPWQPQVWYTNGTLPNYSDKKEE